MTHRRLSGLTLVAPLLAVHLWMAPGVLAIPTIQDLDVTYIDRTPRYDYNATKNNPAPGDNVTFTGHITMWGTGTIASVGYAWYIDGAQVATGTLTSVTPTNMSVTPIQDRTVTLPWVWQDGNHYVKLVVDPANQISESSELNNVREDRVNAIIAGFWVERSAYQYFQQNQNKLGVGSNSWDDWIQRQMAKQNQLYAQAIWPISPQGVLDRVRIDKIIVVPDGALPLAGGLPTNRPDASDRTVDLMWGFTAEQVQGTFYANHTSTSEDNPFYLEKSLIHELGHARYLIDYYGFDVHNTASYQSVQILENGQPVAGSQYMPFVAFGEVLYYNKSGGVMSGPYGFQWSPSEAGALNLIAGRRAQCGNYNAPCNIGVYLQNLPQNNHMRFVDSYGHPWVDASVQVYRATGAPSWYGKTFDNTPDAFYQSDGDGYVHLPRNPFTSGGNITHTYGLANGVIILRIQSGQRIWYRFVEAPDFNMQHWMGNTQDAYYSLTLSGDAAPEDRDHDGDVDMTDFGLLQVCLEEPGLPQPLPVCTGADLTGDGVVDHEDVMWFEGCLSGANVPFDPLCRPM